MVSLYGEVRLLDMSAMAYITRIKKTFLLDAMRSSQFIKRMERLTKAMNKYLSEAKKKVLTLTVSKQWFDMIVAGEKTEENRVLKPYWVARLFQNNSNVADVKDLASCLAGRTDLLKGYINTQRIILKPYTHVLFVKGYPKGNKPSVEKEIESITIGKPKKGLCPDKWLDTEFFIIKFK